MTDSGRLDTAELKSRGKALKVARTVVGLSQTRLAERAGLAQTRVHLLEHGKAAATPEEWAALWQALSS